MNRPVTAPPLHTNFDQPFEWGGKKILGRLAIPSGIRCTRASTIAWCFSHIPSIGLITTKSISLAPRAGYVEPIYARYAHDSYINAVGLANPGAERFRRELEGISVPEDKFLLVSVFGGNTQQFVETALALRDVADGFELNMSCPHAEGYGVEIGQNRELVAEITAAVGEATGLPVIVKLAATVGEVGLTAKAAVDAGAAGITVTNTVGPAILNFEDTPILSNKVGGLSGAAIRPLGLRAVKRVREAIGQGPLIIGMGGIATAEDVRQFHWAGADVFGIGSALTGMDGDRMENYFAELSEALRSANRSGDAAPLPQITMRYSPAQVLRREEYHTDLFKLVLDRLPIEGRTGELAGRYFFLCIPGVGEKPFAVFSAQEKSIVVKTVGRFTQHLAQLKPGDSLLLRGPYGRQFPALENRTVVMVGGGTGIASLLEIGKLLEGRNRIHSLLGGRSANDLFDTKQFSALGPIKVATNDGSAGHHGFVSDLLRDWLKSVGQVAATQATYVLCGPEPMVEACFALLRPVTEPENIWGAVEYITSCGVGICGKCASPSGALSCIDGPFMQVPEFERRFGPTPDPDREAFAVTADSKTTSGC